MQRIFPSKPWHVIEVRFGLWVGSGSHSSSLHLHTVNLWKQARLPSKKALVVVAAAVGSSGESGEAVEIELSLERRDFRDVEVMR